MFLMTTYSSLLRLYPSEHKAIFAQEMVSTFEHAAQEHRRRGWLSFARFAVLETAALTLGIATEWVKKQRARDYLSDRVVRALAMPIADESSSLNAQIVETRRYLELNLSQMERAIAMHDFPNARLFSDEDTRVREQLRVLTARRDSSTAA